MSDENISNQTWLNFVDEIFFFWLHYIVGTCAINILRMMRKGMIVWGFTNKRGLCR